MYWFISEEQGIVLEIKVHCRNKKCPQFYLLIIMIANTGALSQPIIFYKDIYCDPQTWELSSVEV